MKTIAKGPTAAKIAGRITDYMKSELQNDQRLIDAIVPQFPVGCRRLTPGIGYLPSLKKKNVRVITEGIAKVVPQGIQIASGEVIELDAIICATGFNVSF